MSQEDYLAHHGVIGMHWGVRKDEGRSSGSSNKSYGSRLVGGLKKRVGQYGLLPAVADTKIIGKHAGESRIDVQYDREKKKSKLNQKKLDTQYVKSGGNLKDHKSSEKALYDDITNRISGKSNNYASSFTDEELKHAVERMTMEKRYRELQSDAAKANMTKGQRFMSDASEVLQGSIKDASKQFLTARIKDGLDSSFGSKKDDSQNGNSDSKKSNNISDLGNEFARDNSDDVSAAKELGKIIAKGASNYRAYETKVGEAADRYTATPAEETKAYHTGQIIRRGRDSLARYGSDMSVAIANLDLEQKNNKGLKS